MDLDILYQDLLNKYVSKKRANINSYKTDVKKVSELFQKNEELLHNELSKIPENKDFTAYPDYSDKNFNKKIFQKQEFNRSFNEVDAIKNASKDMSYEDIAKSKCSDSSFKLTPNQEFIRNFLSPLTPYNGLLLFHSVGVGKTCTAISIAEQYHQLYQKPILVILSPTLIENFKKQIFDITKYDIVNNKSNLCTGTKYPDMILDRSLIKPDVLDKNISKIINQRYKFISYKKLISIFQKTKDKVKQQEKDVSKHDSMFYEKIKEYFSNRMIIIDEAHNLRNSSEKGNKLTAQVFWNLLKHTENVKMVLLTATPMFNNANEIVWFLNLLLTNDKRPNLKMSDIFDKNGKLTVQGRRKLIETARGYVSYMRGENPFSFPMRLYPDINNDKNLIMKYPLYDVNKIKIKEDDKIKFLKIIGSEMKTYQKMVYDAYKKRIDIKDDIDTLDNIQEDTIVTNTNTYNVEDVSEKLGNDLQTMSQISNIVYPVSNLNDPFLLKKTYGVQGFNNVFINTAKKGLRYKYNNEVLLKYGEILSYNKIENYAPKMKRMLDYVINSQGIVFIYTNYYPSGILPLAIALEHIGFTKYNSNGLTSDITIDDKFKNKKRPSYVILSRDNNLSPNNDKEIEIAKSRDNANGDFIKVVISRISEGVDFKRIREVHMLEPWYNLNKCEQIIGRAVRTCSHIDLPKEERNVTVFFHATKYDEQIESVDLWTYRIAENKQKRITEVERIIKETSIDCNLNRSSLLYAIKDIKMFIPLHTSQGTKLEKYAVGDRDYSYVCNYAKCELKCEPEISINDIKSIDTSTYDVRFIMDDIQLYQRYIAELYKDEKKAFTYITIYNKLSSMYKLIDEEVLQYSLQDMIDEKIHLYDIEGTRGYLIYRSNKYMFQPFNTTDKRMTLEQRETPSEVKNRVKLDLSVLKSNIEQQQNKNIKNNQNVSSIENKKTTDDIEYTNVLQYIEEMYISFFDLYGQQGVTVKKYEKYVIDSIIDKLSKLNYIKLFKEIALLYNNDKLINDIHKSCLRSLIEADVIIFENSSNDNKIKYFYNHYDGEIYCLRSDNEFKRCSPLDIIKISKQINLIKNKMTNEMEDTVRGHIDVSKNGSNCDFKVRDNPKSSGYVCWKTSSLSLSDLKDRIALVDKSIKFDNLIKKDICLIYEIILRSQGKKVFKRSITKNLK